MNAGRIEQLGAPREVYERPATRFVAGFIGTSNLISRRVESMDGSTAILATTGEGESIVVPDATKVGARTGASLDLTVRPEKISLTTGPTPGLCCLRGTVAEVVYLGTATQYGITVADGTELLVFLQNSADSHDVAERGAQVWLSWRPEHSLALQDSGATASAKAAARTDETDKLMSAAAAPDHV
jgi:spermidine/putrescine transport system ATP-binding protein